MDIISLILLGVQALSAVTNNPALGGGSSVRLDQVSTLLGILASLIQQGQEGYEDLKAFTATVQAMADENRPPRQAEWDALTARRDAAHDRLQKVKEEIEANPEPEPVKTSKKK